MITLKRLRFLLLVAWISLAYIPVSFGQVIYVSGTISTDTTWAADTVKVTGNIYIDDGVTLTIPAGTYVEAQTYCEFHVGGCILATGAPTDSIIFSVADTNGLSNLMNTNAIMR